MFTHRISSCVTVALAAGAAWTLPVSTASAQEVETRQMVIVGGAGDDGEVVFDSMDFGDGGMMMFGGEAGEMIAGLPGMLGGAGSTAFPISGADVDQYGRILRFGAEQIEAAKTLLDGYMASYKTKSEAHRAKVNAIREEAKENEDRGALKKMSPLMAEMRTERENTENAFINDFKAVATADQLARWEKVEMFRRRGKSLRSGGGFLNPFSPAGDKVDLVKMYTALEAPEGVQRRVDPILDAYELDIDAKLKARADIQKRQREAMRDAAKARDFSGMMKFEEEQYELSLKLRDANRSAVRSLKDALPPDLAAKLDGEFRKACYPQIHRVRYAAKALGAAEKFEDLSEAQRKELVDIRSTYMREADLINRRNEEAQDKKQLADRAKHSAAINGGEEGMTFNMTLDGTETDPELEAVRKQRRELEDRTVNALNGVLTTEQRERLPARPGTDAEPGQGGPGNMRIRSTGGQKIEIR
ncbi:MAG: hypothetical protein ACT4PL_08315 [Phycisphaerales bacterium]